MVSCDNWPRSEKGGGGCGTGAEVRYWPCCSRPSGSSLLRLALLSAPVPARRAGPSRASTNPRAMNCALIVETWSGITSRRCCVSGPRCMVSIRRTLQQGYRECPRSISISSRRFSIPSLVNAIMLSSPGPHFQIAQTSASISMGISKIPSTVSPNSAETRSIVLIECIL